MIKSVIKNGELYLERRKWADKIDDGCYFYYFTDNIFEAVLLPNNIANIWLKNIVNTGYFNNEVISIKEIEVLLKNENELNILNKEQQYILMDEEGQSFVKDVRLSLFSSEVLGYKYTNNIEDAKYLNKLSLKNYLSYKNDEKLVVKSVSRKEIS